MRIVLLVGGWSEDYPRYIREYPFGLSRSNALTDLGFRGGRAA